MMRDFQVAKLNNQLVRKSLLAESKNNRAASYNTLKNTNTKPKEVGAVSFAPRKTPKIAQIEVPSSRKVKTPKSSRNKSGGIPTADRADQIVKKFKGISPSKSKKAKSKKAKSQNSPVVYKTKTRLASPKPTIVKKPSKDSDAFGKSSFPSAKDASSYTSKMPKGASNLGTHKGKSSSAIKVIQPATIKSTTRPIKKIVGAVKSKTSPKITQVKKPVSGNKVKHPQTWQTNATGINVMESVQFVINGKPKAKFGIINMDVAIKLAESYESYGYDVEVHTTDAVWKKDRVLLKSIFESVDAKYNNAPNSARRARGQAMNRFFKISQRDYNNLYENKQMFTQTVKAAFNRIMEQADRKYREKLKIFEGPARVVVGTEVIDLDLITQALNTEMALRNFRNEIVEEYGFGTKIKHIFIDGKKYNPENINEWTSKRK